MARIDLNFDFLECDGESKQREFVAITKRNSCFSGGYGNGKTYAGCIKALLLLTTFPKYRMAIVRRSVTDLKNSTRATFFKVCPPDLYDEQQGGKRTDSTNYLRLINGSEVFWLHLDDQASNVVRGLEVNSVLIDQAEEVSEEMYEHLDSRVGRWDRAEIPEHMNVRDFQRHPKTGKPIIPSYMMILCNPDTELHWIYQRYHPESEEHHKRRQGVNGYWSYKDTHQMIQADTRENETLDPSLINSMMSRGRDFVHRFVEGKWGIPEGQVHSVDASSVIENVPKEFLHEIIKYGQLYRVLDHGDSAPTACLWFSVYKRWIFCYREYYQPNELISRHRVAISELSRSEGITEEYRCNWADPSIFKKSQQKFGGFWTTSQEYSDPRIGGPALFWQAADNNEMLSRSRINEMLALNDTITHPLTGQSPAPTLYFLKRCDTNPYGIYHALLETKGQKRKKIALNSGQSIYSEEREKDIPDHAYDCVRYFANMRAVYDINKSDVIPVGSFDYAARTARKRSNVRTAYGGFVVATPEVSII